MISNYIIIFKAFLYTPIPYVFLGVYAILYFIERKKV